MFARQLVSQLYLRRRIADWIDDKPDLVVLPNDAAFPYDFICSFLRERSIPFVLVQEGIRFPLPAEENGIEYGSGGALRIAAWGEASSDYFQRAGVDQRRLRLTGSPRFDQIAEVDWSAAAAELREHLGVRGRILTLLTNPIDDQGFCSTAEKLDLVARFARSIAGLLAADDTTLVMKLHARESAKEYRAALREMSLGKSIKVAEDVPLYPLLAASSAAVTLASTAGLEALLFNLPLGVLKLPAVGYAHDYVSSGAAWGLEPNGSTSERVREMLHAPDQRRLAVSTYLDLQISRRTGSSESVATVIAEAAT
jgi:hypothetical protein